jgi:hypothetical protein
MRPITKKGKIKANLSLCLVKHEDMESYLVEILSPRILHLGTRWRRVPTALTLGNNPRYTLDSSLGGPQSWSGRGGEEKIQAPSGNRILVAQPITLSLH